MIKNIKGTRLQQKSLQLDISDAIAGQQPLTRSLLILLIIGLVLIAGFLAGLRGAAISLFIIRVDIEIPEKIATVLTALTEFLWIGTATLSNFRKSLIPIVLSIGIGLVIVNAIEGLDPVVVSFSTLAAVAITALSYVLLRTAAAVTDILLHRARLAKLLLLLVASAAAFSCGAIVVDDAMAAIRSAIIEYGENAISLTPYQVIVVLMSGITFSLTVAVSAIAANHRKGVPWKHPDFFRSLALTVGSWQGTSFHNLDLSNVSFRNAQLANTDLRAQKLYRTCFQGVTGLERARVDSRYLDLEIPKVQKLLTHATSDDPNYDRLNLRGAYLQGADLRRMSFIDADLSGADLQAADLRGAILARAQAIGTDFSNANLTGICIQDWSVNDQTCFSNVICDYVYRELDDKGEPTDRYPADRNFEPQEFESLYQEIGNVAELVFKEGVNWRAFSFSMQKLELEDNGMGLELKGFERKGDRWVVRVTHNQYIPKQEVELRLTTMYEEMKGLLASKEEQINKLLGIASDQAEALKEISQKPFGNSFFITGSTITNLTGSGNIEYTEAAQQVRNIITHGSDRKQVAPIVKQFVQQLKQQDVATTGSHQLELMQQLIVAEAEEDQTFRDYLLKEGHHIIQAMAGTPLTKVIQSAIAQLNMESDNGV